MVGCCANADDQALQQLNRQQSATIESLKSEILRLNQELEEAADSRAMRSIGP